MVLEPEDILADDTILPPKKFKGYYIGRKVPYSLLKKAMGLQGKALAVYVGLWVVWCRTENREIRLERKFFEGSGLSPTSITRGITALVDAWLIDERSRRPGATPVLYLKTEEEVKKCEEALAEY